MTHAQFIKKWDGKGIDYDGAYGYQCVDLARQYMKDVHGVLGTQLVGDTAYKCFLNGHPDYEQIENKIGNEPEQGDIIFWNTSVGPSGHVAVYDSNWGKLQFNSFDQNWPVGSLCHMQSHDYSGVAGWIRYKYKPMTKEERKEFDALEKRVTALEEKKGSRKQLRRVRRKLGLLSKKK